MSTDRLTIGQDLAEDAIGVCSTLASHAPTLSRMIDAEIDDLTASEVETLIRLLEDAENVRTRAYAGGCGFCHGQPVGNAAEWLNGRRMPAAPCPRCGVRTPFDWERRRERGTIRADRMSPMPWKTAELEGKQP